MKLDGEKLLTDIKRETDKREEDSRSSAKIGWYEACAKSHIQSEAMHYIRMMIERGDYTIEDKG